MMSTSTSENNRPRVLVLSYDSEPIVRLLAPLLDELSKTADVLVLAQFPETLRAWRKKGFVARTLKSVLGWEHGRRVPGCLGTVQMTAELAEMVRYESKLSTEASMEAWAAEAERITACFSQLIDEVGPSLVLAWNAHTLPFKPCVAYARKQGIPVRVLERGFFPGSLFLDSEGANHACSIKGLPELPHMGDKVGTAKIIKEFVQSYRPIVAQGETGEATGQSLRESLGLSKDCFVFLIPEQLNHDSNTVLFCDTVESNLDLVQACVAALRDREAFVVFKPHPESSASLAGIAEALGERGAVVENAALAELLAQADAVITRNSTLGLEALLFGNRVVAMGHAIYTDLGMTADVRELEGLGKALEDVLERPSLSEQETTILTRFVYRLHGHHHYFEEPKPGEHSSNAFQIKDLTEYLGAAGAEPAPGWSKHSWSERLREMVWEFELGARRVRSWFRK